MLINYDFKNSRSFYSNNSLSLHASFDDEYKELNTFKVNSKLLGKDNELLKSIVIFGPNASGKSNVLKSLLYMKSVILYSATERLNVVKNNEYFKFYIDAEKEDSKHEVTFIYNHTLYKYGFIINNGIIINEYLYKKKERLTLLFERNYNKITKGLNASLSSMIEIPSYSLFVSIANMYNLDIKDDIKNVIKWFNSIIFVYDGIDSSFDIFEKENNKYKEQALKIMSKADLGIQDIEIIKYMKERRLLLNDPTDLNEDIVKDSLKNRRRTNGDYNNYDVITIFNVYDKNKNIVDSKSVYINKDDGFNSEGTKRILNYLGYILYALDKGRVLLIDELDSKLHHVIVEYILELFNSIDVNKNNAQLICTVHDVLLMDKNLRRDQIYFTNKDKYGESSLYSLSEFKGVRKNDLFSKKYLAGFYTNIPEMEEDYFDAE